MPSCPSTVQITHSVELTFCPVLLSNHRVIKAASAADIVRPSLLNHMNISSREMEVLQLLAKGARNSDIAHVSDVTESSVKRILQGLFERFEAANRAELLGRIIER